MKQIQRSRICIQLKSDFIPGSGQGWGNIIDTDVVYDQYGFPYIPARRIKGVLKESALELEEFGILEEETAERIFGNSEQMGHHFVLYNALLENLSQMHHEYQHLDSSYQRFLSKYAVLDYYTDVRYQTAIDDLIDARMSHRDESTVQDGIAKDDSLRSVRVIHKGEKFYSLIEYEVEDKEIIEKCLYNVRHMGLARTRGFGEVELTLRYLKEEEKDYHFDLDDEQDYDIKFYYQNETPLSIASTQGDRTLDYMNGAALLGYFAQHYLKHHEVDETFYDLFIKGKLKFSPAYISDEDWNEYYPVRESIHKEKIGNRYFDQLIEKDLIDNRSKVRNKYMTKEGYIREVQKEIIYHHRRPEDKSIGHVIKNSDSKENGMFYQQEAMSAKQNFIGHIYGKGKDLKLVLDHLGHYIQIGASKYVQYGNVYIDHVDCIAIKPNIIPKGTKVICTLVTPLLLLNEKNESLVHIDNLQAVLPLENTSYYVDHTKLGGYNAKWQLQKPSYTAFKEGSCIKGELTQDVNAFSYYGSLNQEGNGLVMIEKVSDLEQQAIHQTFIPKTHSTIQPQYLKKILVNAIKESMRLDVFKRYTEKEINRSLNPTTVGRILSMMNSQSWNQFNDDVSGIADEEKRKVVVGIINEIVQMCDDIWQQYPLIPDSMKEEFYLESCKEYFIRAKLERREG